MVADTRYVVQESDEGAGRQLRRRNKALLIGAVVLAAANLSRVFFEFSGVGLAAVLLLTVGAMVATAWLLLGASRRRRRKAQASGGFGSSSSLQIAQLRNVPRFAPMLDGVRKTWFTGGWIGGGVVVDEAGITWTPTDYSRRKRNVPILHVPWTDVRGVRVLRTPGVAQPAILEAQLPDGSAWAMNVSGYDRLCEQLASVPVRVEHEG